MRLTCSGVSGGFEEGALGADGGVLGLSAIL